MNTDIINTISLISALATLLLFLFYFIGRLWTIFNVNNEIEESFDRECDDNLKIIDSFDIGKNTHEKLYLTANHTLLSVKIYKCKCEFERKKVNVSKTEEVLDCGKLQSGCSFEFNTYLVEGIPQYCLEYISHDFTKGKLYFVENGKNGVIKELVRKKHTLKSLIYYLVK